MNGESVSVVSNLSVKSVGARPMQNQDQSGLYRKQTGSSPIKSPLNSSPSDLARIKVKTEPQNSPSKLNSPNHSVDIRRDETKNHVLSPKAKLGDPGKKDAPLRSPESGLKDLPKIPKIKRESSPTKGFDSQKPSKIKKEEHAVKNSLVEPKVEYDSDNEPLSARLEKVKKEKNKGKDKNRDKNRSKIKENLKVKPKDKVKIKKEEIEPSPPKKRKKEDEDSDSDFKYDKKAKVKKPNKKEEKSPTKSKGKNEKTKGKKVKEEEQEVWKWWEEEPLPEGVKWLKLEHAGPFFPPPYERLPPDIKFFYDGQEMRLSDDAEEIATFYSKMLDHDYTQKKIFNDNFFEDWRKAMTDEERKKIKNLKKCDFSKMHAYFKEKQEERKNMTKEEKQKIKEENEKVTQIYGFCMMDGHKQKVGNFKIEPPGLFRGRGDHPKQGKVKLRVRPEEVIINIGTDAKVPIPPDGHKWKAVQHDNKVTWLACWIENIAGSYKYVMLNSATKLKGEKDWQKYETARKLKNCVDKIRGDYQRDLKSKEMRIRQRAVALYFIDRLALRAGHEKEEGETADTVGCCSLRVEHITLHDEIDGRDNVVEFDFLGKDSIRYTNKVPVEKRVFKNLKLFTDGKQKGDDLFDRLSTTSLNKYLGELMEGLTAKVFRTYNASKTLQEQLAILTNDDDTPASKLLSYNRANRAVAILCNHQRAAPKTFDKQMENLMNKISDKKQEIKKTKKEMKELKIQYKETKNEKTAVQVEKKKNQVKRLEDQLLKLEVSMTDKEENKEIALGTSKLNYLDPRISIAWCKKHEIPVEKVYNKTQRQKFQWAIDMTDEDFEF